MGNVLQKGRCIFLSSWQVCPLRRLSTRAHAEEGVTIHSSTVATVKTWKQLISINMRQISKLWNIQILQNYTDSKKTIQATYTSAWINIKEHDGG